MDIPFPKEPQKKSSHNVLNRYFTFVHTQKPSDTFLLVTALLVFFVSALFFIVRVSNDASTQVPAHGGTLKEGIVGTPRFINPVLAVTRADRDLTELVYDGLMRLGPTGTLVPNIAESITISEDGLTYNIIIRKDVVFHDGTPLTASDVIFTVSRIQDPALLSPLRSHFEDVGIEEIGPYEVNFVLPEAYAPFIENLTFGILPAHIWRNMSAESFTASASNLEPVGAGPYTIAKVLRDENGIPEHYALLAHESYHLRIPYIRTLQLYFYPNDTALRTAYEKEEIQSMSNIDPRTAGLYIEEDSNDTLTRIPLPKTISLFINQNKAPALRDPAARYVLNAVIDRKALVTEVLAGYASPINSPVPPGFGVTMAEMPPPMTIDAAQTYLSENGWKPNPNTQVWEKQIDKTPTPLAFSIATVNNSNFEATAEYLRTVWTSLGANVTVKQFETSDLTQSIVRPRDYESILFGTDLGRSLDYYAFWHSSQRNDPGLNIALYANITTDSILTEMRRNQDIAQREAAIQKFSTELEKELPAFFLYTPEFLYLVPKTVRGTNFTGVSEPYERFSNVHEWYIETESVWPIFTDTTK